ncbi:hypothetical protein MSAN_00627100 [Mycena sanguinolenta]|uniref:Uncharacterized protein n=1 Tax=Mycena sanguinolenta TaxID=230812 RepID=A0A8H7DEE8_9AGAR|nr:hypothetical protein MSAN_00627100 [Mycena sanguinolenta]
MLLILLAIHLLSRDSSAAPLPRSPDARASTDSCKDIDNCRTLFSIVWGCLATIFACTWVLKMMLIAIIAPEVMVGFAARQYFGSRELANEYKFSSTQAFFFCMGGFVSPTGHPIATKEQLGHPIASKEQLEDPDVDSELQRAIQKVNDKEIKDKSKGDALSKGVALLQGLWPPTQPDTVETVTFPFTKSSLWERFWHAIAGYSKDEYQPLSSVSVPSFWSMANNDNEATILLILVGTLFGAIHCAAWNAVFPTPAEMWIWRTSALVIIAVPVLTLLIVLMEMALSVAPDSLLGIVLGGIVFLTIPIYIAARIILIVLPLVELRFLPASAFVDVNWSSYIPHI